MGGEGGDEAGGFDAAGEAQLDLHVVQRDQVFDDFEGLVDRGGVRRAADGLRGVE